MTEQKTTDPGFTDPGPVPARTTRTIYQASDELEALSDNTRRRVLHFLAGYAPQAVNIALDWAATLPDTDRSTDATQG